MKKYDYLIVGSGLFGSAFARRATDAGRRCLVIDKRPHTGGNLRCESIEGINVHCYGPHIFHTSDREVWDFVNSIVPFRSFINAPVAFYKGRLYNLPFNMNTFTQMWGVITPDQARARIEEQRAEAVAAMQAEGVSEPRNLEEQALLLVGRDVYQKLIKGYTEKQWGRAATELPAFIIRRVPFRFTFDNNYFNDRFQGIPCGGYNALTDALLNGIEVRTGCDYLADRAQLDALAGRILFTGCIDAFYDFRHGHLDYRSLRFEHKVMECPDFQGNAVVNYTERSVPYTRVIEHKHFDFGTQPHTVVTYEYPDDFEPGKEPYYPVNDQRNAEVYGRYRDMAAGEQRVLFGGRLAGYTYADMDDTIAAALALARRELHPSDAAK